MQANDVFEPTLKYVLGEKLSVRFKTPAEIDAWVSEERKLYSNIMPAAVGGDQAIGSVWNQINQRFEQFNQTRQSLNNANSTTAQFKQAIEALLNYYTSGNLIHSQSAWGLYVAQLASSEPQLAARVLVMLGNIGFQLSMGQGGNLWLRAGAISEGLRRGWIDQKPVVDIGLQKFRQDWESKLQGVEDGFQAKIGDSTALVKSLGEQRDNWSTHLTDFAKESAVALDKLRVDANGAIEQGVADIDNFKKTYNSALALRAPTQYWHDKAVTHRNTGFYWLAAFVVVAAIGLLGCWFVWHETAEAIGKEATYSTLLPTIGAAALAAWFLRICSRQVLSNFALGADASERVAMVKTYLALSEGGHASEKERGLILAAIFRPSTRVTDDAAPPSWLDLVSKEK